MCERVVLTQYVLDWLAQSDQMRVLQVLDRACNLINERDEIISVVWPELGAGPFAIVLEEKRPFSSIMPHSKVYITGNCLQIESLQIDLAEAILWQACPDWETIQKITGVTHPHPNLPPHRGKGLTPSPSDGAGWGEGIIWQKIISRLQIILAEHTPTETAVFQPKLIAAQQEFLAGLQENNLEKIKMGASQLAGLGQGLTPTGDDFLVGTIIALWALGIHTYPLSLEGEGWGEGGKPQNNLNVIDLIVKTAVPRTTRLSGAWLCAAGRGEVVEAWHDVFAGLGDGGWETAVSKILQIGHSSGYDALVGFTAVFENKVLN